MNENEIREEMAQLSKSLYERGLTFGASGNISVKLDDGWLMSPTGVPMGELDPDQIHTPGVFVQRIIKGPKYEKRIEQRTVSQ